MRAGIEVGDAWVPMRDGARLHARVWRPAGAGERPAVLQRGYGSGDEADAARFAAAGYAYVGQATRGHGASEGPGHRFFDDADDGWDTLSWLAERPWCDGRVAMVGRSYMALTQWLVAPLGHPALRAIVPRNAGPDPWARGYWSGGALTLALTAVGRAVDRRTLERGGWARALRHVPLHDLDVRVGGRPDRLWREYVAHSSYDAYWRAISTRERMERIRVPVFLMGGWYDYYAGAALDAYARLRRARASPDVRVAISATDHLDRLRGDLDLAGGTKDEVGLTLRWLDRVLAEDRAGLAAEPPVALYVLGAGWRRFTDWPPPGMRTAALHLVPRAGADGRLDPEPAPASAPPSRWRHDPEDPVPTLGAGHSLTFDLPGGMRVGPVDHRPIEGRADVRTFTADPLDHALELVGPVSAELWVASSAPDADVVVRVLDVHPNGSSYNLAEGVLRLRFREDLHGEPRPLEPGRPERVVVPLAPVACRLPAGHRLRVHVQSSSFPLWDRNPGTGRPAGVDAELRASEATLFHDAAHPSRILLPVLPAEAR